MRKLLLVVTVAVWITCVGTAGAEWVNVSKVINGNTFETTDGEVVNIIGLSRTPETQMTSFYFEDNDVWVERKVIDDSGRTFAVVDLHGAISYSSVVDAHKYEKASNSVICLSSNKKYVCKDCKSHCKSPNPYSIAGGRRVRRVAKNQKKTWKEFYGTTVEDVTIAGGGSDNASYATYTNAGRRGRSSGVSNSKIQTLKAQVRKLDLKIRNAVGSAEFHKNIGTRGLRGGTSIKGLRDQRRLVQEQINDLELVGAGANPSWVMDSRRDTRDARIEKEGIRAVAREEAQAAANSRVQQYIAVGQ